MPDATELRFDIPHSARVWNYYLGGKDNYPADRELGDAVIAKFPEIQVIARHGRQFLVRAVRYLAGEAGVDQFLDIGTGLPTMQNTHEVAQSITPSSRIVYVDNDPLVLAHARTLLVNTTPEGVTTYVHADVHEPEQIIADARNVLNMNRPIAVMLLGILGHTAPEFSDMFSIIRRLMDPLPSGSYLVLLDGAEAGEAARAASTVNGYTMRTLDEFRECFAGLELIEPGIVQTPQWRQDPSTIGTVGSIDSYCGVARKP